MPSEPFIEPFERTYDGAPICPFCSRESDTDEFEAHMSKDPLIDLRKIVEATLNDPLVPQGTNSVKSAQVVLAMREWLAAHDAEVRRVEREKCAQIATSIHKIVVGANTAGEVIYRLTARFPDDGRRISAAIRGQSEEEDRG